MLYVSGEVSDSEIEVSDSRTNRTWVSSFEEAKSLGKVYGLGNNTIVTTYRDVDDFLTRYCLRQKLVSPLEFKLSYTENKIVLEVESYSSNAIKTIAIPDFVDAIADFCFEGYEALESVVIPNSVMRLGDWCFGGCSALESIVIPDSVIDLGASCFNGCSALKSIVIPDSVLHIGNLCFDDCTSLESISIPNSVKRLGDGCFWGCVSLESIDMPSVESLGHNCFVDCTSLRSVAIPSVTFIGDSCFLDCTSLSSMRGYSSVRDVGRLCLKGTALPILPFEKNCKYIHGTR